MLVVLLLWVYIFSISIIIGFFSLKKVYSFVGEKRDVNLAPAFIAGTLILTVYAEAFSCFYKVGAVAHILMLVCTAVMFIFIRKELIKLLQARLQGVISLKGLIYLVIILAAAFCTSRGTQHADTYLYHAQAIRWIEEYGVVKGLGNLMPNFAYNSSWLCYTALFSMKFLTGVSLHTTNGLMMAFCSMYAIYGLLDFKNHRNHLADAARIAILFYDVVVCVVIMSPSTDQPAMYLALYITLRWLENMEEGKNKNSVHTYALLCVAGVYTLTLKLSAGLIVILVISPLITLIKNKDIKSIIFYIVIGFLTALPFFMRNYFLSGWLLFPFPAIDLFNVEWKIPAESVLNESYVIKSYARKTYEGYLATMSIKEWFPYWWAESEHYDRQLLIANFIGFFIMLISLVRDSIKKIKVNWNLQLLNITLFICVLCWLFQAPFVRFALGYLIVLPMLAVAEIVEDRKLSVYNIAAVCAGLVIITCFGTYWSHYTMDALVYVKHNLTENYWIMPKDYEATEYETDEIDGVTFYYSQAGQLSYYSFPGAANRNFEMIGDNIKEGFKYKENN